MVFLYGNAVRVRNRLDSTSNLGAALGPDLDSQNIENKDPVAPWGGVRVRVQAASCKTAAARAVLPIYNLAFSAPTQKNCHFMIPRI